METGHLQRGIRGPTSRQLCDVLIGADAIEQGETGHLKVVGAPGHENRGTCPWLGAAAGIDGVVAPGRR